MMKYRIVQTNHRYSGFIYDHTKLFQLQVKGSLDSMHCSLLSCQWYLINVSGEHTNLRGLIFSCKSQREHSRFAQSPKIGF